MSGTVAGMTGSGTLKAIATAAKAVNNTVPVNINGITTTVNVTRDQAVALGDVVLVTRIGSEWWVIGRAYASAPASTKPAVGPDPGSSGSGQLVVAPVSTRSYRNGSWRTDNDSVYQGEYGGAGNHTGCVFYGTAPRSLAGATVTAASIHVRRLSGGVFAAQSTTMWLISDQFQPSGAPTRGSSTGGPSLAVNGENDSYGLLGSWGQAFVDGTAGGLAFFDSSGSPYVRFAGRGDWSAAFSLVISWRR